jgi:hypothetical protein
MVRTLYNEISNEFLLRIIWMTPYLVVIFIELRILILTLAIFRLKKIILRYD